MTDGTVPGSERPVCALVGLRCSGKTTVSRALAEHLGADLVDLDEAIAREAGVPHVATLIERDGIEAFRAIEERVLAQVLDGAGAGPLVLSTGGGAVESEASRARLADAAFTVWLRAPLELLRRRLAEDCATPRPTLAGDDAEDEFTVLDRRRAPLYESVASLVLDVEGRSPAELADAIAAARPK